MKQPIPYVPGYHLQPKRELHAPSAWKGIPNILPCLFHDFQVGTKLCVEFGVEHGYSTVAFSEHFHTVIGVDTFLGLGHNDHFFDLVKGNLKPYDNIELMAVRWQDFITFCDMQIDLIHVDIDHNYEDTHTAAAWAVLHAPVVVLHDTLSYPDVMRACSDIAESTGIRFYNFEESHGLGILSRMDKR